MSAKDSILSLVEIKQSYPDQWVAIAVRKTDADGLPSAGVVLVHDREEHFRRDRADGLREPEPHDRCRPEEERHGHGRHKHHDGRRGEDVAPRRRVGEEEQQHQRQAGVAAPIARTMVSGGVRHGSCARGISNGHRERHRIYEHEQDGGRTRSRTDGRSAQRRG